MVSISDHGLGVTGGARFQPLPPLVTVEECLDDALPVLDPPSRLTVTDAAERHMRVQVQGAWQAFDRAVTPYMVEPADVTTSRLYQAEAFVGPSQSGKTKTLEAIAFHGVTCDPRPALVVHMTRNARNAWVDQKVNPTIANSPAIQDRLGKGANDSTLDLKRFLGMGLGIMFPTPTVLSGGTYALVLLTDLDRMPAMLGSQGRREGTPFSMAQQRVRSFLSRGFVFAESSPGYPVKDLTWKQDPAHPHELPPVAAGIVLAYNMGTRGRWYWECRDCGKEFEPTFERLEYDKSLDPGAAGASAVMVCPHCGSWIEHRHKLEFNRATLQGKGGWRHEAANGKICALGDAGIRETNVASHQLNGAAATFANWRDQVAKFENALRQFEMLHDDAELAGFSHTEVGLPYRREVKVDDGDTTAEFLAQHAEDLPRGVAPEWTRFVTITADVQKTYFPVQVMAWGDGGKSCVIDRFDLTAPPEDAPMAEPDSDGNQRRLDPAKYAEDWAVLEGLESRVVPVLGQSCGLRPIGVVVDFQGAPGVSDNAETFWRSRKKAGVGKRWFLSRGEGTFKVPFRVRWKEPEAASKGKKVRSIKLLFMAVDRIKDTVASCLSKADGGTGGMRISTWMAQDLDRVSEFVAEERTGKGWVKRTGFIRNEGFDLCVQGRALAEHKGLARINWSAPPAWALGGPENSNAVDLDASDSAKPVRRKSRPRRLF